MSRRKENLQRLAELGIVLDEPAKPTDPVIETDEPSSEEKPETPEPTKPTTEEPAPKSPDGHDWEKRKADAQEAQRTLAATERRVDAKLAELTAKTQELERLVALKTTPTDLEEPATPSEFDTEYPELSAEMRKKARQEAERVRAEERKEAAAKQKAEDDEAAAQKEKSDAILREVFDARPDAATIANSQPFQDWLDSLPARLSVKYREFIEHTTAHSAQDALDVLDLYERSTPPKPAKKEKVQPDETTEIPPSDGGPKTPAKDGVRPLTKQELLQINSLIRNSKNQAERELWNKRLHYTFRNDTER